MPIDRALLLIGLPACGKTTLATQLTARLKSRVLHLDPVTIIDALAREGADLGAFIKHNPVPLHLSPLVIQELHCLLKPRADKQGTPPQTLLLSGFPTNAIELSALGYIFGSLPVSIVELTGIPTQQLALRCGLSDRRYASYSKPYTDMRASLTHQKIVNFDIADRPDPVSDLIETYFSGVDEFAPLKQPPTHVAYPPVLPPMHLDLRTQPADVISAAIIAHSTLRLADSRRRWNQFCGTHPISLNYDGISEIVKRHYVASPKVDGTRLFTVVHGSRLWFVNRRMHVWMGPPQGRLSQFHDTLLDTEASMTPTGPLVTVIDVIAIRGTCVRSEQLFQRLEHFTSSGLGRTLLRYPIAFALQSYLPLTAIPALIHKVDLKLTDGIVFTPTARSYRLGQSDVLFKWKPNAQNTVDLSVLKHKNGETHGYCTTPDENEYTDCGRLLGSTSLIHQPDGTIVECVPHPTVLGAWSVVKTRHDKSRPNFSSVVQNILRTIHHNITSDDLVRSLLHKKGSRKIAQ